MTLRLVHLSDIHFGGENVAAVAAATEVINSGGFDLAVVSGDLTRYAEIPEFEAAAAWLKRLTPPLLVTPGNHDAPYLAWAERIFAPFRRYGRLIGPADVQEHRGPGFAVRGLNTARGAQPRLNWSKGQIAPRQVQAAVDWFTDVPAQCVRIVVCHHPLTEMVGGPMTARVWGGEAAARDFAKAKIDLVLSGHIHAPFTWPYAYGDGRTYAVGAGTLSTRERGVAAGFNVVEIGETEFHVSAQGWTGSHFETLRTWSLDRRRTPETKTGPDFRPDPPPSIVKKA